MTQTDLPPPDDPNEPPTNGLDEVVVVVAESFGCRAISFLYLYIHLPLSFLVLFVDVTHVPRQGGAFRVILVSAFGFAFSAGLLLLTFAPSGRALCICTLSFIGLMLAAAPF